MTPASARQCPLGDGASRYARLLRIHIADGYRGMFRPAGGKLDHPFMTPGSKQYDDVLWDWDSWLANVALRQTLLDAGDAAARKSEKEKQPAERRS